MERDYTMATWNTAVRLHPVCTMSYDRVNTYSCWRKKLIFADDVTGDNKGPRKLQQMVPSPKSECAICMVELCGTSGQGCRNNHTFHVVCILEWLKRERSCPLCREHISCLTVNEVGCGRSLIELPPTPPRTPENNELEHMLCEVCHLGDDEAHLLLCDMCDKCYHMRCLQPPLSSVPDGYWYCPPCERERAQQQARASSSSARTRRQITRTALSQNVRSTIRTIVNPNDEDSEESSEEDYESSAEGSDEEETEENVEDAENFSNDEDQDGFVLDALDQPGPSRAPPRIPTRRGRKAPKKARKTTKRGKRTKRRKSRKSTRTRTARKTQKGTNGYNAVQKRLAGATNVNLKTSTCYNVKTAGDKTRGRPVPIGGTLNLFKAGIDEYISESDSDDDSDSFELSANARKFDRPLLPPPRKRLEPVQGDTASEWKAPALGLLDEILENQTKTLAPSSLLKIRRDGTLEERKEMKEYRRMIQDKLCSHPAFKPKRERSDKPTASNMSLQNDNPSTSVVAANTSAMSNGNSPKKSRWGPAQPRTPTTRSEFNGNNSASPHSANRVRVLQQRTPMFPTQMQRNAALLPLQPFLTAVSLADVVGAPPPPPPPVIQGANGNNVFTLQQQLMSQMFSPLLSSGGAAGGIDPALLGMLSGAPATSVPFTVANLNAIPMPVPPPPPPPVSLPSATTPKSAPSKTNDDSMAEMDISPQTSGRDAKDQRQENGSSEEGDRSKLRKDADKEMKKALIPYFRNKKITKEEYKSLMKRGVYKLVKRGRPVTTEAATKLAMNYVFELTDNR
uniref:PHD-type domain-containing protein n=1 Tax=Steinernema glaseri TaxID=37863 RepID=A0A1I7ZJ52_9BILA